MQDVITGRQNGETELTWLQTAAATPLMSHHFEQRENPNGNGETVARSIPVSTNADPNSAASGRKASEGKNERGESK